MKKHFLPILIILSMLFIQCFGVVPMGTTASASVEDDVQQIRVSSPIVNEGSPYVVFKVESDIGNMIRLHLEDINASGGIDYDSTETGLEYFDPENNIWKPYISDRPFTTKGVLSDAETLVFYVRVKILNNSADIAKQFKLCVTVYDYGVSSINATSPLQEGDEWVEILYPVDAATKRWSTFDLNPNNETLNIPLTGVVTDGVNVPPGRTLEFDLPVMDPVLGFTNIDYFSRIFTNQDGEPVTFDIINVNENTMIEENVIYDKTPETSGSSTGEDLSASGWVRLKGLFESVTITGTQLDNTMLSDGGNMVFFTLARQLGNACGTATIMDNGTGNYWIGDETKPATADELANENIILDDDRPLSVTDVTVHEIFEIAVFTVNGGPNQLVQLELDSDVAIIDEDFGSELEYFDGNNWVSYTPGTYVALDSDGTLQVRTSIVSGDDLEGPETFLLIATNTGGTSYEGIGTIVDDDNIPYDLNVKAYYTESTLEIIVTNYGIKEESPIVTWTAPDGVTIDEDELPAACTLDGQTVVCQITDLYPVDVNQEGSGVITFSIPLAFSRELDEIARTFVEIPTLTYVDDEGQEIARENLSGDDDTYPVKPLVAIDDSETTMINTPVSGNILENDSGIEIRIVSYFVQGIEEQVLVGETLIFPDVGELVIAEDGTYTFTPALNYAGEVPTVVYTIEDLYGLTTMAHLNINVTSNPTAVDDSVETVTVNNPPTAIDDSATTPQETPVTVAVLSNDTDPNGDGLTVTTATTADGTVAVNPDGTLTFTPAPGFTGIALINYTITDGKGGIDTAVVRVNVPAEPLGNVLVTTQQTNGTLLPGTPVRLLDQAGQVLATAVTENNGTYLFTKVAAGTYTVDGTYTGETKSQQVTVVGDETAEALLVFSMTYNMTLSPSPRTIVGDGETTSVITAVLKDKDGNPLVGVPVQFTTSEGILLSTQAITDANGIARVILQSEALTKFESLDAGIQANALAPNGELLTQATMVTFTPAKMSGQITNEKTGLPIAGATVTVKEDFDGDGIVDFYATVLTDANGYYEFGVPRSNFQYTLDVVSPVQIGNQTVLVRSKQKNTVGEIQQLRENFLGDKMISGQLFFKAKQSDDVMTLDRLFTNTKMIGTLVETSGTQLRRNIEVEEDGSFSIDNLPLGSYRMVFQPEAPSGDRLAGVSVAAQITDEGEVRIVTELIDPFGLVTNVCTNERITGVLMQLYWADTELNKSYGRVPHTLVPLPRLADYPPLFNENPQITQDEVEYDYSWLVFADGDYYFTATKEGYVTYDTRNEKRNVPALPGEDSYIIDGIIHVGETIVEYDFVMQPLEDCPTDPIKQTNPKTGDTFPMMIYTLMIILFTLVLITIGMRSISKREHNI